MEKRVNMFNLAGFVFLLDWLGNIYFANNGESFGAATLMEKANEFVVALCVASGLVLLLGFLLRFSRKEKAMTAWKSFVQFYSGLGLLMFILLTTYVVQVFNATVMDLV